MGSFKLQFRLTGQNLEAVEEVRARLQDFSAPFAAIVDEWAKGNEDKFAKGKGAELTGVDQPPAFWASVSPAYYRQKHGPVLRGSRTTYPDWLMVRTGDLAASLTSPGAFSEYVDKHRVVFGTPLNQEDADKAMFNREKRPTIFLGRSDRQMVRREMSRYLSMGENYRELMFAKAGRLTALKREMQGLDMRFADAMGSA